MSSDFDIVAALCALAVPLVVLSVAVVKSHSVWSTRLRRIPPWQRALAVAGVAATVLHGGDKPEPPVIPSGVLEILTLTASGGLNDVSGKLVPGTQAQAVQQWIAASGAIVSAADSVVAEARVSCAALTNQLLAADYDVAYVAVDLPRGTPAVSNHNIMVSIERTEQSGSVLDALVWFSSAPSTNVNVVMECSVADGVWSVLEPVTNFWPSTETVGGVECVRYRYALASGVVGTPFRPSYEVTFGGYNPGEYLSVPESGIVVTVDEVERLPFTGWDDYGEGTNTLSVRYVGGIAVEAVHNGVKYEGSNG